uniref:AB hydrolase-1 domain-containing protein n=1 Tax=Strombidium rassoulzadegani TaxID=1082188 RepID=A0A7S3FU90_9SPIT|mmetsp:Transcript_12773/g.21581  ORF Transcript_12773/g.21581 Transcript_12773/m.21581 type:complete len:287 (+) Transcript_12773:13-873(+)
MDPSMLTNMIIRPPKADYPEPNMGKAIETDYNGKKFKVDNFQVANFKGELLSCSFVEPANDADRSGETMPCVIYMHGNAGNKTEGLSYAAEITGRGLNLCCFDFSGCGNSEGDWVTLGHKEKDDLKSVIEYIYENKRVSTIGLWGRSMGGVTSLLYASENPGTINCAVLDSAFSTLDYVIITMAGNMGLPPDLVEMFKPMIDQSIQMQAGFQIKDLDAVKAAALCESPVLFLHGKEDTFIIPDHCDKLFASYKGEKKEKRMIVGDHNSPRPDEDILYLCEFLKQHL